MRKTVVLMSVYLLAFTSVQPCLGATSAYKVKPGDFLEVQVLNQDSLTTKQPVSPDGTISLPLLGRLQVEEKTLPELDQTLQGLFAKYVERPQVSVYLTPAKPPVSPKQTQDPKQTDIPIYLVLRDLTKGETQVKAVKTPEEAKAWMLTGTVKNGITDPKLGDNIVIETGIPEPAPIWIVFRDLGKNTIQTQKVATVTEARAIVGTRPYVVFHPTSSSTEATADKPTDIRPGDSVHLEVGQKPDFLEDNWYKLLTGAGVVVGLYNSVTR